MKLFMLHRLKGYRGVLLALTIILGFAFLVLFSSLYVSDAIQEGQACGCVIPIPYMILILASLGLFCGSLASYILLGRFSEERKVVDKGVWYTLNFLPTDEREVLRTIIDHTDTLLYQSRLERKVGMDRVKLHRTLGRLVRKGLVRKEREGKRNRIILDERLKGVFT